MTPRINQIETTFGKKGSGKTNLLFNQMARTGGKIIYFSPVQFAPFTYKDIWSIGDIMPAMENQRPGEILHITNVSLEAFDLVCCGCIIYENISIFLDEANHYVKSTELSDLVDYGRHACINIFGNTRRYTDIPRKLTANSDFINVFRTNEPRDLDYLRHFCGRDVISAVPDLLDFHYIRYNTTTHEIETLKEKYLTS